MEICNIPISFEINDKKINHQGQSHRDDMIIIDFLNLDLSLTIYMYNKDFDNIEWSNIEEGLKLLNIESIDGFTNLVPISLKNNTEICVGIKKPTFIESK